VIVLPTALFLSHILLIKFAFNAVTTSALFVSLKEMLLVASIAAAKTLHSAGTTPISFPMGIRQRKLRSFAS